MSSDGSNSGQVGLTGLIWFCASAGPLLQAFSTAKGGAVSMLLAQQISCSCLFQRYVIEI
jgi:hypothetical protein